MAFSTREPTDSRMNPPDWGGAMRSLQRHQPPYEQTAATGCMKDASEYYSTYDIGETQRKPLGPSPPPSNFHITEDPDGEPIDVDEEDPELTRKRRELQEIEERIMHKKVSIALKAVKPFIEVTPGQSLSSSEASSSKGASLKERVKVILQARHPVGLLSKVQPPNGGMKPSSMRKGRLLQEDHPLKLRVEALMRQRCRAQANMEVPDDALVPLSRSVASPAVEDITANQGFQRFLSVLNKGVDMDLLSRIVNDDSDDLPLGEQLLNVELPAAWNEPDPPAQRSNSGEQKTDPPGKDDQKKNDLCFSSSSRSRSPPAVKEEEEKKKDKPEADEQHQQLQNILKTLGLSLEMEEMSELTNRTQERLYGKKQEVTRTEDRPEEGLQASSDRARRNSSSSSSSSSSSRSNSRSQSPGPSSRQRSDSGDSRRRSRERPTSQESKAEEQEDGNACEYPHPQNLPHPAAAFSANPHHAFPQYPQYNAYSCDAAANSHWPYAQYAIPPFPPYPAAHPYPQNSYHGFRKPAVPRKKAKKIPKVPVHLNDNLLVNPDLSESEGQLGSSSRSRCLQVVSVKKKNRAKTKRRRQKERLKKQQKKERRLLERKELEEKQRPRTEEEIRTNLRKKLEVFNEKMKLNPTRAAKSLPFESVTDDLQADTNAQPPS